MKKTLLVAAMVMSLVLALVLYVRSNDDYDGIFVASSFFACLSLLSALYLRERTEPRSVRRLLTIVVLIAAAFAYQGVLNLFGLSFKGIHSLICYLFSGGKM